MWIDMTYTWARHKGQTSRARSVMFKYFSNHLLFVDFTKAFDSWLAIADNAWNGLSITLRQDMVQNLIKAVMLEVRITQEWLSTRKVSRERGDGTSCPLCWGDSTDKSIRRSERRLWPHTLRECNSDIPTWGAMEHTNMEHALRVHTPEGLWEGWGA